MALFNIVSSNKILILFSARTGDAVTNYESEQSESRLTGPPTTGYSMAQQAKQYVQGFVFYYYSLPYLCF